ncbi:uncharacterized protein CIMG_12697 [Coccidioides immitis RS]|uniref:Uncharacterized protein n=1 Tax=Coccidioides immitis (strain RS) TaxID=246410 RepID=A0A0D8JSB4_COCIM|nr:uncharacterized protein CIMG_12697 [Coccidioides immitis RS]KJF60034.1 hypothetical protein CIMG_12697 [Coccidioides immitis RS]
MRSLMSSWRTLVRVFLVRTAEKHFVKPAGYPSCLIVKPGGTNDTYREDANLLIVTHFSAALQQAKLWLIMVSPRPIAAARESSKAKFHCKQKKNSRKAPSEDEITPAIANGRKDHLRLVSVNIHPHLPRRNSKGTDQPDVSRSLQLPGVRCPTCQAGGKEVWVIPGKNCHANNNCGDKYSTTLNSRAKAIKRRHNERVLGESIGPAGDGYQRHLNVRFRTHGSDILQA